MKPGGIECTFIKAGTGKQGRAWDRRCNRGIGRAAVALGKLRERSETRHAAVRMVMGVTGFQGPSWESQRKGALETGRGWPGPAATTHCSPCCKSHGPLEFRRCTPEGGEKGRRKAGKWCRVLSLERFKGWEFRGLMGTSGEYSSAFQVPVPG